MSTSEADRRQQMMRALAIIRQFNESDLESLHVRQDDFEIALSRTGAVSVAGPSQPDAQQPAEPAGTSIASASLSPASRRLVPASASPERTSVAAGGEAVVRAPMVGTIYLAPDPGSPPFVTPGSRVEPSDTVMLVEAMKLFTAVTAGRSGVVRAVLVDNASFVEYGQELLTLDTDPE